MNRGLYLVAANHMRFRKKFPKRCLKSWFHFSGKFVKNSLSVQLREGWEGGTELKDATQLRKNVTVYQSANNNMVSCRNILKTLRLRRACP